MTRFALGAGAALLFVVLAAANSGGYRFGVSDQAYYVPAIEAQRDPGLFPRDRALIDAQSGLIATDELLAGLVNVSGVELSTVAAVLYVVSLAALLGAAVWFARGLGFSWWAVAALGILLTLRHRIAKTGANSLEGYFHPRQLAFALGVASLACLLRRQRVAGVLLILVAAAIHLTTGVWFLVAFLSARIFQRLTTEDPSQRKGLVLPLVLLALTAVNVARTRSISGRLVTMDDAWLQVLATKDYLFPTQWPLDAWLLNLAYPAVIFSVWRLRHRLGVAVPGERMLLASTAALVLLFALSLPLTAFKIALPVQLQVTRVFWVLDFLALAYFAWWATQRRHVAIVVVAVLAVGSAARGYYLLEVDQPERSLARVSLPNTAWVDAMRWLRSQPPDWHVLADPGHAWRYGSSVRVAALRDTTLEEVKDSAVSLYARDVAMRVAERIHDLVGFETLTTTRARYLDTKYDLDAVVVERPRSLDLPVLFSNGQFVIYDLR